MSGVLRKFDPDTLYAPQGRFHNAVEVPAGCRLVYSSGLIGLDRGGTLVSGVEPQIRQAWANVAAFLEGCGMTPENLVRMTMHLTDPEHIAISKAARIATLGESMHCAVTGMIVGLFDPDLFIEIDVMAASEA